jgi:accessory colonization factor AcfC
MTSPSSSGALEAVERILNRGGEPDDVLSAVVSTLQERTGARVGIAFPPQEAPSEGVQTHAIVWQGEPVATLWTSEQAERALFARVAVIVSPYCNR